MIKKKEKEITNTELLESINRSFDKIETKMATKEDIKDMATKTDIERLGNRIDDLAMNRVRHEEFDKLKVRVEKLEAKTK